jgi:RND family efflux transporter MFP subunit
MMRKAFISPLPPKPNNFMMRILTILCFLIAPLGAVEVMLTPLQRGTIHRWVTIPATLQPNQSTTLHARVSGHLRSIYVDVGDRVSEEVTIASLEVPELEADFISAVTAREVAATTFQRLSVASEKAPGLVLPQDLEEAEGAMKIADAAFKRKTVLLAFANIKAPYNGIVTARHADLGAFIPAGGTGNTGAVVTIADVSILRAHVSVPEAEAKFMKPGTLARIVGHEWEGKISRSSQTIDPRSATMKVEVDLANADGKWINGSYVKVQLAAETHTNALLAPVAAVLIEKVSSSVFLYKDGKAVKTPVTTGFNDGKNIEILTGLQGDETPIILTGLTLTDGQAVAQKK